ncbi:hypothetical protein [Paracoccus sp. (in: a-proteobacteria)]|uniref:hypothetical protein n=1 Tax=Paracoccus sp. TaxID=267 RepID=UPI003A8B4973
MLEVMHNGRLYVAETSAALRQMGVPDPAVDAAGADARMEAIKAECRRRIYAVASAESQMNMAAAVGVIAGKSAAERTAEETATMAAAESAIGWVAAMRAAIVTLAEDANADFTASAVWPDVPPDAVAMIDANF